MFHFIEFFFGCSFRSANIVYHGISDFEKGKKLYNVLDLPGVQEGKNPIDILILEFFNFIVLLFSGRWSSLSVYRGTTERDRTMNQGRLHQQLKGLMDSKIRSHKLIRQLLSYDFTENIEKVFRKLFPIECYSRVLISFCNLCFFFPIVC
jgi:hypothetical protein